MPKPRKLPWIDSIPKIIYYEYFWVEEKDSRSSSYKARLKKEKLLYPTNYALRERGYKESLFNHLN